MLDTNPVAVDGRTTNDDGTADERVRYGHALGILAVLLRAGESRERVAQRLDKLAGEIDKR